MTRNTRYIGYSHAPRAITTLQLNQVQDGFVFAPRYNQLNSAGQMRSDASSVFIPKAQEFINFFSLSNPLLLFDNDANNDEIGDRSDLISSLGGRRREILSAIDTIQNPINVVAYFGHGADRRLLSAGFRNESHRGLLADAIANKSRGMGRLVVVLYACSSGSLVDGGFARELYSDLRTRGISSTVFGHETPGYATKNPYKRKYPGGSWIVEPDTRLWSIWRQTLRDPRSDLWIRYPFMEPYQIVSELEAILALESTTPLRARHAQQRRVGPSGLT